MNDLERRDGPTADPIGHFGVFDFAVTGSYARRLTDHLDVGGSFKYLHEKIDKETAKGVAVDLGGRYRIPGYDGLTAAVTLLNLGPQMKFIEEKFDLPVMYKVGAALDVPVDALHGNLVIASDAVIPADGSTKVHFGMEDQVRGDDSVQVRLPHGVEQPQRVVGPGRQGAELPDRLRHGAVLLGTG